MQDVERTAINIIITLRLPKQLPLGGTVMERKQYAKLLPSNCNGMRRNSCFILLFMLLPTLCQSFASTILPTSPPSNTNTNTNTNINPKLAIRRIKSQARNVTHSLKILETNGHNPSVVVEALRVCGNCQKYDLALEVFQRYPSEPARTMTISVLGSSQDQDHYQQALLLLLDDDDDDKGVVTSASYNAAIAACGRAKDWERALEIHNEKIPKEQRTTLTTNALMTILAQCRKGAQALRVLQDFQDDDDHKDDHKDDHEVVDGDDCLQQRRLSRATVQSAIYAMVRSQMELEAFEVLEKLALQQQQLEEEKQQQPEEEKQFTTKSQQPQQGPTDAMFDILTAAFHKRSNWEYVRKVEQLRHPERSIELSEVKNKYSFQQWRKLEKVGIGKRSYFVLGHVWMRQSGSSQSAALNVTIGVQPNRNPGKNGIHLEFYENHEPSKHETHRTKLGFLLMQNSAIDNTSTLLGMFLTPASRGKGISKACMAVWLSFCLQANIRPKTGVINKPLLALALQHTFGFPPKKGGIDIELVSPSLVPAHEQEAAQSTTSASAAPPLWVYTASRKTIEGAFSPWDIQNQNICMLSEPPQASPETRRLVSVRTAFETPSDLKGLQATIDTILPKGSICSHLAAQEIRRVYLGKE
ncbi:MAG: hypothetical protein SGBAC_005616 [Bacillariaceae sp.]